jgi:putative transposase
LGASCGRIKLFTSLAVDKTYFTRALLKSGVFIPKNKRDEYSLWQRRFWEHRIRNEHDLIRHVDYIHYNPVKHKLVKKASDWQYSNIHRYIQQEMLPRHWADNIIYQGNFGESC